MGIGGSMTIAAAPAQDDGSGQEQADVRIQAGPGDCERMKRDCRKGERAGGSTGLDSVQALVRRQVAFTRGADGRLEDLRP